jgi:hypothetical protein
VDHSTQTLQIFLWAIVKCSMLYISAIISLGGRRNQLWFNALSAAHCYRR